MVKDTWVLSTALDDVHLDRAPLVLALCQMRFNDVADVVSRDSMVRLRERLMPAYPDLGQEEQHAIMLKIQPGRDPEQIESQPSTLNFKLRNPESPWWLSISRGVATLVTNTYTERSDFMGRITALREALADVLEVPALTRLGVRYVSRVTDDAVLDHLDRYVRRELLAAAVAPIGPGAELVQSFTDIVFQQDDTAVRLRTGLVPPGTQPDTSILIDDQAAWLCDIDAYDTQLRALDERVDERASLLAEDAYQLFRWVVTNEFLKHHGGDV